MGDTTFTNIGRKYEMVTCAGEVRFVPSTDVGPTHKLQQRFEVVSYDGGMITGCRQEWRDVPTVPNGDRGSAA